MRRDFIKTGAAAALALSPLAARSGHAAPPAPVRHKPLKTVRVGYVGVGHKGSAHVANLLRIEGVELKAVCDIDEKQCVETQLQAERLGKPKPTVYSKGPLDYQRMCATEDLDLVYTATPWELHVPVCLAAMRNGKHAASEVPVAHTAEECWKLVEASEKNGRYCVMMENVNYFQNELVVYQMVRKGLLGELVHGEAGYMHDTRQLKINDFGDGKWLGDHHATRNGNLYPTHGLGPLAWYMNLNRGDRLQYMVSMSSNARGMDLYAKEHLPEGHPKRTRKYINGDVNNSLMRTANGLTIVLKHDTDLPRPYSRTNLVQGTRGIVRGFPDFVVSLEGQKGKKYWEPGAPYAEKYEHPLWRHAREVYKTLPGIARDFGPIGKDAVWSYTPSEELRNGDFLEDYRLIQALLKGISPDFDVYDAASWSVVSELSEKSVANRSRPVDFPDFTKGRWKTNRPVEIMGV